MFAGGLICGLVLGAQPGDLAPWKVNAPIVVVQKELYTKHPQPLTAAAARVEYAGPRFELREWQAVETEDDVYDRNQSRWSLDNGRTWSDFVQEQPSTKTNYRGVTVWEGGQCRQYDPTSGKLVEIWLRQIQRKGVFNNFSYYRTSDDLGRTWTEPKQLCYESGGPFDPQNPLQPAFLARNQGLPGNNILIRHDGALVHCLGHANAPNDPRNAERAWKMGSVPFIGRWDAKRGDYSWTAGQGIEIPSAWSLRGLMEPEVAELEDRRLLVVWRGSNTATTPGRKWYSTSSDGGKTLSPIEAWRYDDGSPFYSPSSYHRMIRHSQTGKLYWVGNICVEPPRGNSPRFPLLIAEVDERAAALKRSTLTVIDDRQATQGPDLHLSNFSLLENRETHRLEMHLTLYGHDPRPTQWMTADNYKYTLTFNEAESRSSRGTAREARVTRTKSA